MSDKSQILIGALNEDGSQRALQSESVKSMLDKYAKTTDDKTAKSMLSDPKQDGQTKQQYKEFLWFMQDLFTKKALMKQKEVQDAKTEDERQKLLAEIREMGEFCRALDGEIKFIQNFK